MLDEKTKENLIHYSNMDKAYNVPAGLLKEWCDYNHKEYPEELKQCILGIKNQINKESQENFINTKTSEEIER